MTRPVPGLLFVLMAFAAPAWAQGSGGGVADALRETATTIIAVAAVCGLAFASLVAARRMQGTGQAGAPTERLRFVRALPVGPRERLVVVEWRGQALLLGVTAGAISVLDKGEAEAADVAALVAALPAASLSEQVRARLAQVFPARPRENPS